VADPGWAKSNSNNNNNNCLRISGQVKSEEHVGIAKLRHYKDENCGKQ